MNLWKSIIKFIITASLLSACCSVTAQTPSADNPPLMPLIKAGDVTFARLETVVEGENSKQMISATIIDGRLRGAKIHGKLLKIQNSPLLVFNMLTIAGKDQKAKKINAYAIDFDAARVAIVTEADFLWLKRRSLEMATTFLKNNHNKHQLKMGIGSDFGILFMKDVS